MIVKILILLLISINLYSEDNTKNTPDEIWKLKRFNFYYENDTFFLTDYDYTAGARISWLYSIENQRKDIFDYLPFKFGGSNAYRSFAFVNQIYTPKDTQETALITDDRPYAGWTYFEVGLHRSSKTHLRSLNIKLGVIGSLSGAENLQNFIHSVINEPKVKGWDNQLKDELGLNLTYTHKWKSLYENKKNYELSVIPFGEFELGNISTKATVGVSMRFGKNIPKDFGVSSINIGADDGIPSYEEEFISKNNNWSFSINVHSATSLVARNIFLDGNTFIDSHSIGKEHVVGYGGLGFTARYKQFIFDFMQIYTTNELDSGKDGHLTGSAIFSWVYN